MLSEGKLVAVGLITLLQACILSVCVAKKYQPCSTSFCGDVTISDPFWLKGNNQSGCSDPNYKLACENNRTTLELYKGRYFVANINYTNHTIRIVDPGLEKGSCFSSPHYYLTFQNFSPRDPYSLPSEWGSDSTVFLKCAVQVSDHNYIPITPCDNSNGTSSSSQTYAYALVGDDIRVSDIPYSCTIGRSLITQSKEVSGHRNRSMSHLQEKLLMGLELSFLKVLCSTLCTGNCTLDFNQNLVDCGEYDAANVMQDAVNCFLLLIGKDFKAQLSVSRKNNLMEVFT
ncbi:LEAF RUST 10 DISEASE-RESISTANCE LOCUS RECEPTOR-LIKE PROTEIN KINASE-like 1.4 [Vitis riparia]|uniref:LEAF RUST 10 DISEASE-RESISTANCE LOCUS RECEPTOR-LIKE PROTEIN KINASE-like 1.4 n=1 Tax=Vitis riparia TaxID=96939 RepID=UPI00155A89CF|nr:LEAF RUST 10 DISEASE-RESISTANCE LOCUS RECEPTOR-LIKE PROTEIN KINASE-like 1.4 [Vitis riparia]